MFFFFESIYNFFFLNLPQYDQRLYFEAVSHVSILYGETFDHHIPIYRELIFPNGVLAETVDEVTEVKVDTVGDGVSDNQLESYGINFDKFSIELRADFFLVQHS